LPSSAAVIPVGSCAGVTVTSRLHCQQRTTAWVDVGLNNGRDMRIRRAERIGNARGDAATLPPASALILSSTTFDAREQP
jgi:hypothetical protein